MDQDNIKLSEEEAAELWKVASAVSDSLDLHGDNRHHKLSDFVDRIRSANKTTESTIPRG